MKKISIGLAMAMVATVTLGANMTTGGDGNWTNITWNSAAPITNDTARIQNIVELDSDEGSIAKIVLGRGGAGHLTIQNDGSLTIIGGGVEIATRNDSSITMNGGQLTIAAGDLTVGFDRNGTAKLGTVDLMGGTLAVSNSIIFHTVGDMLSIENDAQLILGGGVDRWNEINDFVAAGNIDWDNGSGIAGVGDKTWDNGSGSYLHTEFDGTDTTVWVNGTIPEPATLGLVAMVGAGLLFIRRRFTS